MEPNTLNLCTWTKLVNSMCWFVHCAERFKSVVTDESFMGSKLDHEWRTIKRTIFCEVNFTLWCKNSLSCRCHSKRLEYNGYLYLSSYLFLLRAGPILLSSPSTKIRLDSGASCIVHPSFKYAFVHNSIQLFYSFAVVFFYMYFHIIPMQPSLALHSTCSLLRQGRI